MAEQAAQRILQWPGLDLGIELREAGQRSSRQTGLVYDDRRGRLEFRLHAHAYMVDDQAVFAQFDSQALRLMPQAGGDCTTVASEVKIALFELRHPHAVCECGREAAFDRCLCP